MLPGVVEETRSTIFGQTSDIYNDSVFRPMFNSLVQKKTLISIAHL